MSIVEGMNSIYLSTQGVYYELVRHSCEGRNPKNAVPSKLVARLRGHDIEKHPALSSIKKE